MLKNTFKILSTYLSIVFLSSSLVCAQNNLNIQDQELKLTHSPEKESLFMAGVGIGTMSGISLGMHFEDWRTNVNTLISFTSDADYSVHLDAVRLFGNRANLVGFEFFAGGGLVLGNDDRFGIFNSDESKNFFLGAKAPIGAQYFIPKTPIIVGLEAAPVVTFTPDVVAFLHLSLSTRVVFAL